MATEALRDEPTPNGSTYVNPRKSAAASDAGPGPDPVVAGDADHRDVFYRSPEGRGRITGRA